MKKKLIITADDFGYSEGRNLGIVESYNRGAVSRVSLIVNAAKSQHAVELAKQYKIPMGLHINITEGHPLSDHSTVSSLIDPQTNEMLGKMGIRESLKQGKLCMKEVLLEITAQIEKYKKITSQDPIHIDGHQHVHILPGICDLFGAIPSVQETRLPYEPSVLHYEWIKESQNLLFTSVLDDCQTAIKIFRKNEVTFSAGFVGLSTMGSNMTFDRLTSQISKAFCKDNISQDEMTCELMVHPGYPTVVDEEIDKLQLQSIAGCGTGPDDFEQSKDREHEMSVLCSEMFKNWLNEENIILCESVKY